MRTGCGSVWRLPLSIKNVLFEHLYHKPALNADELMEQLLALREEIRPYGGTRWALSTRP